MYYFDNNTASNNTLLFLSVLYCFSLFPMHKLIINIFNCVLVKIMKNQFSNVHVETNLTTNHMTMFFLERW